MQLFEILQSTYKKGKINSFVNLYSYNILDKRKELCSDYFNYMVDGQALIMILNSTLGYRLKRASFDFTSLADPIFKQLESTAGSIYFVGSDEKSISKFVYKLSKKYKSLNVKGWKNGYFNDYDKAILLNEIIEKNIDYVICGMGTPKQEEFLLELKKQGWVGTGFTCGGFFHQTAKSYPYYPWLVDRLHLRWAYRMFDEPKLVSRYFIKYPMSAIQLITKIIDYRKKRDYKA